MRVNDFGPVPVSQMKAESKRIFDALDEGRRVLISRHGEVVAAIDPPRLEEHEHALAMFAVAEPSGLRELSATTISQRSPAEFVREAESGTLSYVTRDHKVHGVLRRFEVGEDGNAGPDEALDLITSREHALAQFERDHPNATAEEFADAVAAWSPPAISAESAPAPSVRNPRVPNVKADLDHGISNDAVETLVDALLVKAQALEAAGETEDYRRTLIDLVDGHMRHSSAYLRRMLVRRSLLTLGRSYTDTDPDRAMALADAAIDSIGADESPETLTELHSVQEVGHPQEVAMG